MAFRSNKDLKLILHPYLFALKEGSQIKRDFLDYSLMMLQVTSPEIIPSPHTPLTKLALVVKEQEYFNPGIKPTLEQSRT